MACAEHFVIETHYLAIQLKHSIDYSPNPLLKYFLNGEHKLIVFKFEEIIKGLCRIIINIKQQWLTTYSRTNYDYHLKKQISRLFDLNDYLISEFICSYEFTFIENVCSQMINNFIPGLTWNNYLYNDVYGGMCATSDGDYRIQYYMTHMETLEPEVANYVKQL